MEKKDGRKFIRNQNDFIQTLTERKIDQMEPENKEDRHLSTGKKSRPFKSPKHRSL